MPLTSCFLGLLHLPFPCCLLPSSPPPTPHPRPLPSISSPDSPFNPPPVFPYRLCNALFFVPPCPKHPCFAVGRVVTNRVQETHPWKDTAFFFFVIPLTGLVTPPGASGTSWARLSTPAGGSPASWISLDCQIVFTTTLAMARGACSQGETHHLLCPPPPWHSGSLSSLA